jgi:Spy/CpxP family protein refolding chaperone
MIIKNILSLLIVFISMNVIAQDSPFGRKKKEQIKSLKIAFITSELSLTSEEATKFWPVYNAYEDKQQDIKNQKLKGYLDRMDVDSFDKLSDKETSNMLSQIESSEEELYQAKKKYLTSLKGVISPLKILKLKRAEENFNRKLLQQYRNRKNGK